jgi:predicted lipoprotein with Yx(FWY)xxD motif
MNRGHDLVVVRVMSTELKSAAGFRLLLRVVGAGLLIATAAIHLDLYLTGYRTISTIGPLFLFQVIAAFALGGLVLISRSRLVAGLGAGFALSTLGGYLLTVQFGLFGFREVRTTAGIVAGIIEVLAFAVLGYCAATPAAEAVASGSAGSAKVSARAGVSSAEVAAAAAARRGGVGGTSDAIPAGVHTTADRRPRSIRGPDWLTAGVGKPVAALGAAVVSVVALGLLAGALAGAGGSGGSGPASSASSGAGLKAASIGGTTVLVNAAGRTLYWFAPDTSSTSVCNGSCAVYWPPVPGPLKAGAGVTGTLATIKRADGSLQETYNGHPLYTYVGDSGPGQAHGNNLNLNGGLWHVVPVNG